MKDLISKDEVLNVLWNIPVQALSNKDITTGIYAILLNIVSECTEKIKKLPVIYSVEKAQEDIEKMKAYERQNMAICEEHDINTIEDLYPKAINECLEIVKGHRNSWDGIEWAIRDIEELLRKYENETY